MNGLSGMITTGATLIGNLSQNGSLSGNIINAVGTGTAVYKGKYEVVPDVETVVLETKNRLMEDNVTVFKIPLWEVSNQSGTTIYIGGDGDYGL